MLAANSVNMKFKKILFTIASENPNNNNKEAGHKGVHDSIYEILEKAKLVYSDREHISRCLGLGLSLGLGRGLTTKRPGEFLGVMKVFCILVRVYTLVKTH